MHARLPFVDGSTNAVMVVSQSDLGEIPITMNLRVVFDLGICVSEHRFTRSVACRVHQKNSILCGSTWQFVGGALGVPVWKLRGNRPVAFACDIEITDM